MARLPEEKHDQMLKLPFPSSFKLSRYKASFMNLDQAKNKLWLFGNDTKELFKGHELKKQGQSNFGSYLFQPLSS